MAKCWLCCQEVPEKARNYKHHCKLFVLFTIGYENWHPDERWIVMTFDQFRENVLIKIGHWEAYFDFEGNIKLKAKSISYAKLGQKGFESVYDRCLTFISGELLRCGKDELHDEVMMRF